jgi:putative DNA primase/helicase
MPTFYSDVDPVQIDDIFPGWILTADVSSTTAIGGGGKGLLSADVMARLSRGWPMPPYHPEDPLVDYDQVPTAGNVLHCTLEDSADRTVVHRLTAAGADLTRIAFLEQLTLGRGTDGFKKLVSEIEEIGDVRLIVIDPWMSAATSTTAFNQQLRMYLLNPLIHLARETGVGIWLMNHFTKGTNNGQLAPNSSKNLTDYVAGSKAFTDTLRMNTVIVDSDVDPKVKVWRFLKGNGGGAEALEYAIVASMPNDPDAHIEWKQPQANVNDPRVWEGIQARILQALITAGQPMTDQAMVKLVSMSYTLVHRAMRDLEKSGQLIKRRGAYQVQAIDPPKPAAAIPAASPDAGEPAYDWWQNWTVR